LSRRLRNPDLLGWAVLAGAIIAAAALVLWLERDLTYGWDEFPWLEIGGLADLDYFWHPYGGHLIAVPYFIFRGTLELFGADFAAFGVIQVLGLSGIAVLVYVYGKRRVGPILALGPAFVLLFLGGSYPVLLEPLIGIQFLAALLPGLAAFVLLEREDLRGDIAASILLTTAIAGFSQALIFLAGAAVSIALSPNWKRRLWVLAAPVLTYGYWRLWATQFDEPTGIVGSNIPLLPAYFVDALAVYATAAFGMVNFVGPGPWTFLRLYGFDLGYVGEGIAILLLELLVLGLAFRALRRRGPIPRTIWPVLVMIVVLFVELGVILIPGRTAAEPRYLYAGVLLLLMLALELARGVRRDRVAIATVLALTVAAVAGNMARLNDARSLLDNYAQRMKADMTVVELAGEDADQSFTPNVHVAATVPGSLALNAGPWQLVAERYGSPSLSIAELRAQPEPIRAEADLVARRALRLRLAPAAAAGECNPVGAAATAAGIALPAGGVTLIADADATAFLGRWADGHPIELGPLTAGETTALQIPADASGVPWRARLEPGVAVELCPVR
jgi:hypothetical protein